MPGSLMPAGMKPVAQRESVRGKTVAMVEGHLNKQRSAYDHWIAELCRDAEESARGPRPGATDWRRRRNFDTRTGAATRSEESLERMLR